MCVIFRCKSNISIYISVASHSSSLGYTNFGADIVATTLALSTAPMQTVASSAARMNESYRDSYVRFGSFMASDSSGHSQQDTVATLHAHPNWVRTPTTTPTRWIEIDGPMCYLNAGCIRNYKQRSTPTESKQSVVSSIGTHDCRPNVCPVQLNVRRDRRSDSLDRCMRVCVCVCLNAKLNFGFFDLPFDWLDCVLCVLRLFSTVSSEPIRNTNAFRTH